MLGRLLVLLHVDLAVCVLRNQRNVIRAYELCLMQLEKRVVVRFGTLRTQ
jgi:hypothetical protein